MNGSDRRAFLASLGRAGAFAAAGSWLPSIGYAQAGRGPVRAFVRRSPGRGASATRSTAWQIGQLQAREYGRRARAAAKQMRVIDPDLRLIACGSSGTFMPTYLVWDREVLEECYDQVDGISLHAYYGNTKEWSGTAERVFWR